MATKLVCSYNEPAIGGLIAAELVRSTNPIEISWGNEASITFSSRTLVCVTNNDVLRALARDAPKYGLYGKTPIERTQIDHWLTYTLSVEKDPADELKYLNKCLAPLTYLVANHLTIADLAVYNQLFSSYDELKAVGIPVCPAVVRPNLRSTGGEKCPASTTEGGQAYEENATAWRKRREDITCIGAEAGRKVRGFAGC